MGRVKILNVAEFVYFLSNLSDTSVFIKMCIKCTLILSTRLYRDSMLYGWGRRHQRYRALIFLLFWGTRPIKIAEKRDAKPLFKHKFIYSLRNVAQANKSPFIPHTSLLPVKMLGKSCAYIESLNIAFILYFVFSEFTVRSKCEFCPSSYWINHFSSFIYQHVLLWLFPVIFKKLILLFGCHGNHQKGWSW